jgi:hypothetical protein
MRIPKQSEPVFRTYQGVHVTAAGVLPSALCATGSCTANGQCCVSILGKHLCIHNPLPVGGTVQACYKFPSKVCFTLNGHSLGCVGI